jgi:lipopolysaccharide/colanic/teichoic acid biosynthesis glycosyltransferase
VGKNETLFNMIKLRSMIKNASKTGVDSTGANDKRITKIGHFIRRYKLDELSQLINVLKGDMSLVGPRPNVPREVALYTLDEKKLLSVKPGITDFSSIVFSDEGDILKDQADPDLAYHQLIRPWKSRLGLVYVAHQNTFLDIRLMILTARAIFSRKKALNSVVKCLEKIKVDQSLIDVSKRDKKLIPFPPPGLDNVVTTRDK